MYCKTAKQQHKEERFHLPTSLPTFQAAPVIQELIGWHHISDYSPMIVCSLVWQWAFGSADAIVAVTKSFACILSVLPVNFTKLSSFILFFRDPQGSSSAPQYTEKADFSSPNSDIFKMNPETVRDWFTAWIHYNRQTPACSWSYSSARGTDNCYSRKSSTSPWENCYTKPHLSTSG